MNELIAVSSAVIMSLFLYIVYQEKTVHKNKKKFVRKLYK